MDVKINELEEKLKKIEAELLEQEHRPFKILWNYFNRKNRFKDSKDKRRKAVTKAVIWRLFISPTTIAIATSGLLGYLSLFLLYKQTNLFKNQNKFIQQQTHLAEASRRSSQMFIMGEVLSDINTELKDPLNSRDTLSNTLVGRIIGLSRSMKPYKYLVGDSLINKPLSPERGQLLIALVESKIDSTFFVDKILKGSDFSSAELNGANLSGANLNGVNLNMAQLNSANLKNANLKNARLNNVRLEHAYLASANFNKAHFGASFFFMTDLSHANLSETYLRGATMVMSNLTNTNFRKANLDLVDISVSYGSNIILDSVKVTNYNWLIDNNGFNSSNQINKYRIMSEYKIESLKFHRHSDNKFPVVVRKIK